MKHYVERSCRKFIETCEELKKGDFYDPTVVTLVEIRCFVQDKTTGRMFAQATPLIEKCQFSLNNAKEQMED